MFADWDFRFYQAGMRLSLPHDRCRAWMIRDNHFKYVHFNGLPNMLFDLQGDPNEYRNLAETPAYRDVVAEYQRRLLEWRQTTEDNSRGRWLETRLKRTGVSFVPDHLLELKRQ